MSGRKQMLDYKTLSKLREKCDVARASYTSVRPKQVLVDARVLDDLLRLYEDHLLVEGRADRAAT